MIINKKFENLNVDFKDHKEYILNFLKLKNPINKKFGILFSGNIRSFKSCYGEFLDLLKQLQKDKHEYDIFYCIFDNEKLSEVPFEFTDGVKIKNKLDFKVDEKYNNNTFIMLEQYISQLYGYYSVFQKVVDYQKNNNIYYEYLMRIRFDHKVWIDKFIFNDSIILPKTNIFHDMNDRTAYGAQYNMYYYFNAVSFINDYNKPIHAESYIKHILEVKNRKLFFDNNFKDKKVYLTLKETVINNSNINLYLNFVVGGTDSAYFSICVNHYDNQNPNLYYKHNFNNRVISHYTNDDTFSFIFKNMLTEHEKNKYSTNYLNFIVEFIKKINDHLKSINNDINIVYISDIRCDKNIFNYIRFNNLNLESIPPSRDSSECILSNGCLSYLINFAQCTLF